MIAILAVAAGATSAAAAGYTNVTAAAGINHLQIQGYAAGQLFMTGGAAAGDFDNNGWVDIFVTRLDVPDILYRNKGVFTDISIASGFSDKKMGRGLLNFDYDHDGDLDLFATNNGHKPILYRNDGGDDNDWLRINVEGTVSNRDGIGTFITVDPDIGVVGDEMVREIGAGSNFLSQNEFTAHFGLELSADTIDLITVVWPSGHVQELSDVPAIQLLSLVESIMPGDFDPNGSVNGAGFLEWQRGKSPNPVSSSDLDAWELNYGTASPIAAAATVPEPSMLMLAAVTALMLPRRVCV